MNPRAERAATVLRAIVHELRTERITFMAGSIAYNAFVSLLPLLLLLLAVVSTLGNQQLEESLISITRAAITPGAADLLVEELRGASSGASALGAAVLVWGTLRIFRSLDTAFSDIYESEAENTFLDQVVDGLVALVSIAAVIVAVGALETSVSGGVGGAAGWAARRVVLVLAVGTALLPMYYVFPDEDDMRVREAVPGVLFTAVGLVAFESLFRIYVEYSSTTAQNGLLAGVLVLLTWLYFSGLVVLVGAAINAVLSNRSDDVNVRPVIGGVPADGSDASDGAAPSARESGEPPVEAVDRLQSRLATAEEVEIVVDGESVPLRAPDRVEADAEASRLPFVNDGVGIELRWSGGAGGADGDPEPDADADDPARASGSRIG